MHTGAAASAGSEAHGDAPPYLPRVPLRPPLPSGFSYCRGPCLISGSRSQRPSGQRTVGERDLGYWTDSAQYSTGASSWTRPPGTTGGSAAGGRLEGATRPYEGSVSLWKRHLDDQKPSPRELLPMTQRHVWLWQDGRTLALGVPARGVPGVCIQPAVAVSAFHGASDLDQAHAAAHKRRSQHK
ncbi:hypothetical protein TREES_T100017615 [Tupaia chinensis]|uniref:Uncharacterized protein n=1 Tax=Tupaia chinensis TaxID=246437 RepID=L9L4Y0_TUPCH|nr:hypothetical protein TREES_T100017615 [Tupaia chinensis]